MRFPTFSRELHHTIAAKLDYHRYACLALAAKRIVHDKIQGSFAEVGVYRGDVSEVLHQAAPERRLYLFDTFEGFPDGDLEQGQKTDLRFRETNINIIKKRVNNSNNVIIRKGNVPETLYGLGDERFAFVLLDLDLFQPTLKSLEFFYPQLNRGGFLFVHDYNNPESNWACKKVVDVFLKDKSENPVELGDIYGTILFRKN